MGFLRRGFYLLLGFTFPGFWLFHADGLLASLYLPLQKIFHTQATGWPSFITASLLYIATIVLFEFLARVLKNARP